MRAVAVLTATVALTACAGHGRPPGPWRFEGLSATGEIRVVPVLHAYDAPRLRVDTYVTEGMHDAGIALRQERMAELAVVPEHLGVSLPGAIHSRLDHGWSGHFRVGHLPMGARDRLEGALRRDDVESLEAVLSSVAPGIGGEATLFTWVTELRAIPLTTEAFPGDLVETPAGLVMVDLAEEPYRIEAEVGAALVTSDGHVILRYSDRAASLLSPHRDAGRVGRDLAGSLAGEIAKMWPDNPALWQEVQLRSEPELLTLDELDRPTRAPRVPFEAGTALKAANRVE